jgi:hypothetical protein
MRAAPLVELAGEELVAGVEVAPSLLGPGADGGVTRAVLAQALAVRLLEDLLVRVPSGAAYVADKRARGEKVFLDHGAVRTVSGVACGHLPAGQASVTRVLSALGYRHRFTYDLARLGMTGRSWCHLDLPESIAQYFVSELHGERFSPSFQEAAGRVLGTSRDPLDAQSAARLQALEVDGRVGLEDAAALLPVLVSCFHRQHAEPSLADYQTLLAESEEMAWIATEGTVCNHMTDRVGDVAAVAVAERAARRPIKETVEVSATGRIRQTAHRAAVVSRSFGLPGGARVLLDVPGSFFEFITRLPLPDGSGPDLAFDAANAQQIFAMTRASGVEGP